MKHVLIYAIAALLLVFTIRFCEKETAGFSVMKIASAPVGTANPSPFPKELFNQKFHFLGQGGQSFVFAGADGVHVLKLIKRRFSPDFLPAFLAKKKQEYVKKKWERDARSYKLAYDELRDETGLLFLHLYKTDSLQKKAQIVDKLGITHEIDLDKVAFILQRRATPLLDDLHQKIQTHQLDAAKERLKQVVNLVKWRCARGIIDEDPRLQKNLGLLGDRVLFIDIGRFKKEEGAVCRTHLQKYTARLHKWLMHESPELGTYLQEMIDESD